MLRYGKSKRMSQEEAMRFYFFISIIGTQHIGKRARNISCIILLKVLSRYSKCLDKYKHQI